MDLWFGGCDRRVPRYVDYDRNFLFVQQGDHADGDRGAADSGRLLDERYDRHLRSHSREPPPEPQGTAGGCDQPEREPDAEPDRDDFRSDVPDGDRAVFVRRASTARFFFCTGCGYYRGDVFIDLCSQPDRAGLPRLRGCAQEEGPGNGCASCGAGTSTI